MASKSAVVQVSGRGTNVDFIIDDSAPFEQVTQNLRQYLVENRGLWSSGSISVNAGRRVHSQEQLDQIRQVIESESGLTVRRFWCSPDHLDQESPDSDIPAFLKSIAQEPSSRRVKTETAPRPWSILRRARDSKPGNSSKAQPVQALFVKTTFRSGESIRYPGDVVVLADVNPGAEIKAGGDIVVFGRLRGLAHAGVDGDPKAAIIALDIDAPRLQIGPYTGLTPAAGSRSKSKTAGPKIAYVRRRSVYVSPYTGRFARYTKGILYEG